LEQGQQDHQRQVCQHQPPDRRAQYEKELPVGRHPLQLYSQGTPNGVKVTIMLEELLLWVTRAPNTMPGLIRIGEGDQFGSGFCCDQPELEDPGDGRSQRPKADSASLRPPRS